MARSNAALLAGAAPFRPAASDAVTHSDAFSSKHQSGEFGCLGHGAALPRHPLRGSSASASHASLRHLPAGIPSAPSEGDITYNQLIKKEFSEKIVQPTRRYSTSNEVTHYLRGEIVL